MKKHTMEQILQHLRSEYNFDAKWGTRWTSNTNGWVMPSGPVGKCNSDMVFERHGFGFEEWNMHPSQIDINGKHCGYVEANHGGNPPLKDEHGRYYPNVVFWSRFCSGDQAVEPGPAVLCKKELRTNWYVVALADKVYGSGCNLDEGIARQFRERRKQDLASLGFPGAMEAYNGEAANASKPGNSFMINARFESLRVLDCPLLFKPQHGNYKFKWYRLG